MPNSRLKSSALAAAVAVSLSAFGPLPVMAAPTAEGESYVAKARDLEKKGDVAGAIIQLKNAVRIAPDLTTARFELGLLYLRSGDSGSAQRELEAARARGYDETKILQPLVQTYLAQGRFQDIIKNFDPAKFSGDTQSDLLATQARAQVALQNTAAAHPLLDKALAQSPDMPTVLASAASLARIERRYQDSEKYVDRGLAKEPTNAELLVLKGEARQQEKDFDGAIAALDKAVTNQPRYPRARLARAMVNLARNKPEFVSDDIDQVLKLDSKNPLGLYLRAVMLTREEKFRDAVDILLGQPGLLENYPPARYLLAAANFGDNQFQSALSNVELYLKKVPGDPTGSNLLAATAMRLNDPKRAVEVLEPLMQTDQNNNQLRIQLASAYLGVGRSEEAIKLFEQGVKADPTNEKVRMALAVSQLRSGSVDAGAASLQGLIKAKPDSLEANRLLILTQLQAGQTDKAVATADAMVKASPKNSEAHNIKGTVSLALKDNVASRASFKAALDNDPKFVPAMLNLARLEQLNKQPAAAKDWYRKALAVAPANQTAFNGLVNLAMTENNQAEAIKTLEQPVAAAKTDPPPRLRLIDLLMESKQTGQALIAARDMSDAMPDDPRSVDALGRAQMANGEYNNGISSYRRMVTLLPDNMEAKRRLARALLTTADVSAKPGEAKQALPATDRLVEEAKTVLDEAVADRTDNTAALTDRLALERKISGDAAALKYAQKLAAERPESNARLIAVGDLAGATGNSQVAVATYRIALDRVKNGEIVRRLYDAMVRDKKAPEALQMLKKWTVDNPTDYDTRFVLTSVAIAEGRLDDAIAETESMKGKLPENPLLLNNLAWLYGEKNNPRAFEIGERALELAPTSADILDTVGWLEVEKRDLAKGVKLLEQAYKLAATNPVIAYHYAAALTRSGDKNKARDVLKETLKAKVVFKERAQAEALLKEVGG